MEEEPAPGATRKMSGAAIEAKSSSRTVGGTAMPRKTRKPER
jgi:hypothetical protein